MNSSAVRPDRAGGGSANSFCFGMPPPVHASSPCQIPFVRPFHPWRCEWGVPVPGPVAPVVHELIDAAKQGNIERVGALLDQGVAVDSRDEDQSTPLMWASGGGHRAVAVLLLDRGANVNAVNFDRFTPAMSASSSGHLDTLQLLVSRGADINYRENFEFWALFQAILYGHLPVCEYLLSLGADLMGDDMVSAGKFY